MYYNTQAPKDFGKERQQANWKSCFPRKRRAIASAAGTSVPPVLVFPRKNFKDLFMRGAPHGSLGLVNPSGWMNNELFIDVLKHFVKHIRPAVDHEAVLVMDNHESHVSLAARENQSTVSLL